MGGAEVREPGASMSPLRTRHASARWGSVLFILVLAIYLASPVKVQSDSGWSVPLALSLVRDGNLDLDEYAETFADAPDYRVVTDAHGSARSYFPVLVPIAIAPVLGGFTALVRVFSPLLPAPLKSGADRWLHHVDATGRIDLTFFDTAEHVLASLAAALAVLLFFRAARRAAAAGGTEGVSITAAWATALIFALATSLYSSVSRLLWQQTLSIPLTCILLGLLVAPSSRGRGAWVGVVLGLLYVARPTHAVVVIAVCVFLALRRREQLLPCIGGGLLIAAAFTLASQSNFGTWMPPYYGAGRLDGTSSFLEAAFGHWVSPARGLAIYSPILLVGLGAFVWRAIRGRVTALEQLAFSVVLLLWMVIASFPHWWGGHSYGPRLFSDALPWACWLLLQPMTRVVESPIRWRLALPVALLALFSVAMHTRGSTSKAPHRWNVDPVNVDAAPARLWDWKDPPFLRR